MPDEGQYDDSLLLRLRRLAMVRITYKIQILLHLYQLTLDTIFCIVLCLAKTEGANFKEFLGCWPCCKYANRVAVVVSFLIKVFTLEKSRADQSLNFKSRFFWKKVPSDAKFL